MTSVSAEQSPQRPHWTPSYTPDSNATEQEIPILLHSVYVYNMHPNDKQTSNIQMTHFHRNDRSQKQRRANQPNRKYFLLKFPVYEPRDHTSDFLQLVNEKYKINVCHTKRSQNEHSRSTTAQTAAAPQRRINRVTVLERSKTALASPHLLPRGLRHACKHAHSIVTSSGVHGTSWRRAAGRRVRRAGSVRGACTTAAP